MDDITGVSVRECVGNLARDSHSLGDRQAALALEPLAQRFSLYVGHGVEQQTIRFAGIEQRQDVRMGQPRRNADLLQEPFVPQRCRELGSQHLQRDESLIPEVPGEVDEGHPTATNFPLDCVAIAEGSLQISLQWHGVSIRPGGGIASTHPTPWLRTRWRLLSVAPMRDLSLSRSQLLLLAGTANRPLAEEMAEHLGEPLCAVTIRRFADGEIFVKIDENVRGRDVFIIQPTNPPAENHLELLFLIDAARRASAARTTAVLPYFGYARQDRKDQPRVAISAKLMANLITHAGADRVLGMDFHSHQLQGFFDIPVDHLYAAPVFVSYFRLKQLHDPVVVAPDVGSAKMARGFAKRLNASLAIIDKRRPSANVAEVVNVVGDVADKDCLIPDDMIDTAGAITQTAGGVNRLGARKIYAFATHALLSGPAVERLRASCIEEVVVANTIRIPDERRFERLKVLSIAGLMAKAIGYEHSNQSVSSLFD